MEGPTARELIETVAAVKHLTVQYDELKMRMARSEVTEFEINQMEKDIKALQLAVTDLLKKATDREAADNKRKGMFILVSIVGGVLGWSIAVGNGALSLLHRWIGGAQ